MYKGAKVKYRQRVNGQYKYSTKIVKFENGTPLTSLCAGGCAEWVDWGAIEKIILSKLPEKSCLMGYTLITA